MELDHGEVTFRIEVEPEVRVTAESKVWDDNGDLVEHKHVAFARPAVALVSILGLMTENVVELPVE